MKSRKKYDPIIGEAVCDLRAVADKLSSLQKGRFTVNYDDNVVDTKNPYMDGTPSMVAIVYGVVAEPRRAQIIADALNRYYD